MTMRRRKIGALAALVAAFVLLGAATALAWTQWASHEGIKSGENKFGPYVTLSESKVEGLGSGLVCAGIRGEGLVCPTSPGTAIENLGFNVNSEPYAHNHSTFTSGFNGFYQ
jgi:hypothetical protein